MRAGTAALGVPGNPAGETVTPAPATDNAGDGTLTLASPATTPAAVDGTYTVEMTGATTFNVLDPRGRVIDKGETGAAWTGPVAFTLAAGTVPVTADDRFSITVLRPEGAGVSWAPLAPDGSIEAAGILFSQVYASPAPDLCMAVAMTRDCEVRASNLTWPSGFSAAQLAEATLQLQRRGIILR